MYSEGEKILPWRVKTHLLSHVSLATISHPLKMTINKKNNNKKHLFKERRRAGIPGSGRLVNNSFSLLLLLTLDMLVLVLTGMERIKW